MDKLTHTDSDGKANMVDVGFKKIQLRTAVASGFIRLNDETLTLIKENNIKKKDVLRIAEIAGIQAAKRTSELIPLCHNIFLSKVNVKASLENKGISIRSEVFCIGSTGVEMEALTAVSVALLIIYDMCKAVDKKMEMGKIKLESKTKADF